MLIALIASAQAATPLFTEGNPEYAFYAVETRKQIARNHLALMDVSALLAPGPPAPVPCTSPPVTQQELHGELSTVLALYDAGSLTEARDLASSWTTRVACLSDVIETDWMWSAGFVTGQLAWEAGDHEGARQAWIQARGVDPTRPWDDDFTPGERAISTFATAFAGQDLPFQTIGGPILLDGRPAEAKVPSGLHVVQTESPFRTWLVDLRSPLLTVHPATDSKLLSLGEWSVLLSNRLPGEPFAFLVRGRTLIEFDLTAHTWRVYDPPPDEGDKEPRWGRWVMAAGAAVVATGLLDMLLVSRPAAVAAIDDAEDAFEEDNIVAYDEANADHADATNRMIVDSIIMATGGVAMAIGAPNTVRTWKSEPIPPP